MARPTKRSVTIKGHRTSLTLEPEFWDALQEIARSRGQAISVLIAHIDAQRSDQDPGQSLTSAVRVFVLTSLRKEGPGPR